MKKLTQLIVTVLSLQISFGPLAQVAKASEEAKVTAPPIAYRAALHSLREMVEKNPEAYLDPSETQSDQNVADKVVMLEANRAMLAKINDNSIPISEVRGEILARLNDEYGMRIGEIRAILQNMNDVDLEQLAEKAFSKGRYAPIMKMKYETAYLLNEKREALFEILQADLSDAKSDAVKRLGLMDRKSLSQELAGTTTLLNLKGDGWKVALIITLSIVAAGLISYGIVSATKNRHEKKMKELEKEYEKKTADEIARHQKELDDMVKKHGQDIINTNEYWKLKSEQLQQMFADRAAIREAGYTWQICSVQNTPKTVTCPYDKKTYVGTETCTSYCLKNPAGQELGVKELICSSAQIPWMCYKPNAYDTGYGKGATDGYNDGYEYGYTIEYNRAYNAAYQDYYDIAYNEGYPQGYQHGFDDGYSDGLADGRYDGYNDGYDDGYPVGYAAGYSYGQQVAAGN